MRIGLVSTPWVPVPVPAYGGFEAVVDRLARGLVYAGHEVLLAAPANSECPVAAREVTSIVEMNHVVRAYAAMTDVNVDHLHAH